MLTTGLTDCDDASAFESYWYSFFSCSGLLSIFIMSFFSEDDFFIGIDCVNIFIGLSSFLVFLFFLYFKSPTTFPDVVLYYFLCSFNKSRLLFFFFCSILEEVNFFIIALLRFLTFLMFFLFFLILDILVCRVKLFALSDMVIFSQYFLFRLVNEPLYNFTSILQDAPVAEHL